MDATKMQLVDWLDDLCVRFVINLPQEELGSVERICFQVEEAQWFYEDFIRPLDPTLPSLPLRTFCLRMFKHCPLLAQYDESSHIAAYETFLEYKTRVPVRGAILLNDAMDQVLLVRGWKKGSSWSFPRGKINKDEKDLDCAIREAREETGYDPRLAGLVPDEDNVKFVEVTMREQHMKLFVFRGVDMEFPFAPQTRKEISKIQWYRLAALPGWKKVKNQQTNPSSDNLSANKLYMVAPFLQPLKAWISQQRKLDAGFHPSVHAAHLVSNDEYVTDSADMPLQNVPVSETVYQDPALHEGPAFGLPANMTSEFDIDAAYELKRLLAVGQSQLPPQPIQTHPTLSAHGSNLLAMLKGNGASNAPVSTTQPLQQIFPAQHFQQSSLGEPTERNLQQTMSQNMPQQYASQHNPAYQPQPKFAPQYPQERIEPQYRQDFGENRTYQHPQFQIPPFAQTSAPLLQNSAPQQPNFGNPEQEMHWPNHTGFPSMKDSIGDNNIPTPNQRFSVPRFAQVGRETSRLAPNIPPASDLPPPRLSNHAMSLLDSFKKPRTPSDARPTPGATLAPTQPLPSLLSGQSPPSHIPTLQALSNQAAPPLRTHQAQQALPTETKLNESRSRQTLAQTLPLSNGHVSHPVPDMKPSATLARGATNPTAQQNTLLSLFRQPSSTVKETLGVSAAVTSVADLIPESLPAPASNFPKPETRVQETPNVQLKPSVKPLDQPVEPVEMSAVASPLPQVKQLFDPKDGKMKAHDPTPRILARPQGSPRRPQSSHGPDELTSATVSGPVKAPDFDTLKRRSKRHGTGSGSQSTVQQAPVQILKRPVTPKETEPTRASTPQTGTPGKSSSSPKKVSEKRKPNASKQKAEASTSKVEAPKPFAPQILRRPKDATPERLSTPTPERVATPPVQSNELPATAQAKLVPRTSTPGKQDGLSLINKTKGAEKPSPDIQPVAVTPHVEERPIDPSPVRAAQGESSPIDKAVEKTPLAPNAVDQKQTLLSLFGKARPAASSATAPQPSVPLTVAPVENINDASRGESKLTTSSAQSSTHSKLDGAISDLTISPLVSPTSVASDTRKSSQTPISPTDKGFLLNFLSGFAKSSSSSPAQKRA